MGNGLIQKLLRWLDLKILLIKVNNESDFLTNIFLICRYLVNHVKALFAGAFMKQDITPIPPNIAMPSDSQSTI